VLGRRIGAATGILPILIMVLLVMPAASSDTIASKDADNATDLSAESESGKAEEVFDFPKDHVLHQPQEVVKNTKLFAEWLYWTGILHDEKTGNPYGIQYTLFQMDLQPGQMAFINHVAVSDVFNSQHPFYGYSIPTDQAKSPVPMMVAGEPTGVMKIIRPTSPIAMTWMPGISKHMKVHHILVANLKPSL